MHLQHWQHYTELELIELGSTLLDLCCCYFVNSHPTQKGLLSCASNPYGRPGSCEVFEILQTLLSRSYILHIRWKREELEPIRP